MVKLSYRYISEKRSNPIRHNLFCDSVFHAYAIIRQILILPRSTLCERIEHYTARIIDYNQDLFIFKQ